jgi:dipeptidyl aminopeptidase/acylaminoacyl peptidase
MTTEDVNGARPTAAEPSATDVGSGWWPSPWSAAQVAAGKVSRGGLLADGGTVYWCESRPDQGGRQVVVAADPTDPASLPVDVSPPGKSVRSQVHEYGGGAATVDGGVLVYVDQDDQAWHLLDLAPGAAPVRLGGAITSGSNVRHADGRLTVDGKWLLSVEERVAPGGTTHRLVATPVDGKGPAVTLVDDGDFVAAPRPSPDGLHLAWVTWDHPDMPWVASRLRVAPLLTGEGPPTVGDVVTVAGGPGISVGQPRWAADGSLLFVDDRTGWWLPYRIPARCGAGRDPRADDAVALVEAEAEFHGPDWVFGQHTFAQLADGTVVACRRAGGRDALVVLRPPPAGPDAPGWVCEEVAQPCVSIGAVVSPDGRTAVVLGSTPTEAQTVIVVDLAGTGATRRLSAAPAMVVTPDRASVAVPRVGNVAAHPVPGLFFPPVNPDVIAPDGPPPLVVFCHGGPTAAAEPGYDPVVQFLTSRGIAVAAVDYRGSSGYGRAYRDLLRGAWGAGDVDDCVDYARALAADGLVDGGRMAIRGTSAGGLTALSALIRARCFAGAVAWYGVTDLLTLAADTHDFESHYTDWLVGPLPGAEAVYRSRSPIHHADGLAGRVLLLQGSADPVVPASQAERFAGELRASGADCRLVVFDGESHGFRRADTIEAALTAELGFYRELFSPGGPNGR